MGLTPHEYYSMTPAEFILMCRGYAMKKSKEREPMRVVAYTVAANTPGRKRAMPSMQRWWPLASDKLYKESPRERQLIEKLRKIKEKQKKG